LREEHLRVGRTARYFSLGPTSGDAAELWIVCHGYGQLASRLLRRFAAIDDGQRLIVAPEALSRFYIDPPRERIGRSDAPIGASWMTREDRESEIEDYVSYLDTVLERVASGFRSPPRLVVLGFSQGVATVCRWVARGRVSPERLILWSGSLPPELFPLAAESPLRAPRLTLVAGGDDEYATEGVRRQQERALKTAGLPFELVTHPGGHEVVGDVVRGLAAG
jgi:predicted esterase